jgi:chemotaxis protein methyltransferase WspC
MSVADAVAALLAERLGLSPAWMGPSNVERAVDAVLGKAVDTERAERTARLLRAEGPEWQTVIEEVIVPESWFFRDSQPFHFLASYVREKWRPVHPSGDFQVLCVPCASGQEPYSVAMTLLDAGLEAGRIRIHAADISERALARARLAIYGKNSFRREAYGSGENYFTSLPEGRQLRPEVTRLVHFEKANLLNLACFLDRAPFDAVFCRNALIYLDGPARGKVVHDLGGLLREAGILFTGHTELLHFLEAGYEPVDFPLSFACRRVDVARQEAPVRAPAPPATKVHRARRKGESRALKPPENKEAGPPPAPLPEFPEAQRLADRGDLDGAAALCERLLSAGRAEPDVYALLAVICQARGNEVEAEELFRKALYLDPRHYTSLVHMSLIAERRGDAEGSNRYRTRAGSAIAERGEKQAA